ncbi:hypothetical protein evm_002566 [Chilo suppressalis]|nr:hypothetical protein evm_002566 [Chilo suppressalis]
MSTTTLTVARRASSFLQKSVFYGNLLQLQALIFLTISCLSYKHSEQVKNVILDWINNFHLGYYINNFLQNLRSDPEWYFSLSITLTCLYIIVCCLYIYAAYKCYNMLMIAYILTEAMRLIGLTITIAYSLLLLRENTMDIGLLIGASVAGGFLLLGMFYLWICVINLPILINEMNLDEQAATINKLRQLLEVKNQRGFIDKDVSPYIKEHGDVGNVSRNAFSIQGHQITY